MYLKHHNSKLYYIVDIIYLTYYVKYSMHNIVALSCNNIHNKNR